jgi:hypothetical protein
MFDTGLSCTIQTVCHATEVTTMLDLYILSQNFDSMRRSLFPKPLN